MREKRKHVRRLNVTEGLLFVVLWGGNEASEGGEGSRTRRGEEEAGESRNSVLAEARMPGSPAQSACRPGASPPNKEHYNQTNAAKERASTLEIKLQRHKIKSSVVRRSTFHMLIDNTQNTQKCSRQRA